MSRGSTVLFKRVTELARRVAVLEDALRETIKAEHDSGRVASGGKLHPTDTFLDCPSMLCEWVREVLTPPGAVGEEE